MINADKLLLNTALLVGCDESMTVGSFKIRTVIGISTIDPIGTLGDDSAYEKASSTVLGFIGENTGYNSLEKSSIATNKYSSGSPFQEGKPFGIEANELSRARLVIALRCTLETFLNRLFDPNQAFDEAILQRLKPLVGT